MTTPARLDPVRAARRIALIDQVTRSPRWADRHEQILRRRRSLG